MEAAFFSFAFIAIAAFAFLVSSSLDKRILFIYALATAIYLGADDFVTALPSVVKGLKLFGAHWNWTGKFLSLVLSALVIVALRLSPAAVGLTLKQRHTKVGLVALLLFIAWGISLGLLFRPGVPKVLCCAETVRSENIRAEQSVERPVKIIKNRSPFRYPSKQVYPTLFIIPRIILLMLL